MAGPKEEKTPLESPDTLPTPEEADRPPPDEPTKELPGSAGKILVMARRYAAGVQLFHPLDARGVGAVPSPQVGSKASGSCPGVDRKKRKWRARVWDPVAKRTVVLGLFVTREEAARAVEEARGKFRG